MVTRAPRTETLKHNLAEALSSWATCLCTCGWCLERAGFTRLFVFASLCHFQQVRTASTIYSNDKFFDVFCRRNKVTNIHTFNDLHGRLALVPVGHQCCSRVKPRQDGRWRKHSSFLFIWSMKHLTTPPTTTEAGANESREDDQKAKNNQHLSLPNRPQEQSSK